MSNTNQYSGGYAVHTLNEFNKRSLDKEGRFFQDYIQTGQMVLDVGCGPGSLSMEIAEKVGNQGFVHGVDVQSEQFPQQTPQNIKFQQASIYQLPYKDNYFDAILAHAVLYHLPDQHNALLELKRVLKPGGFIGIRDAEFGGDVCHPQVDGLDLAWTIADACFATAGSDIYFGRKQASFLKQVGLDVLSLSASYDVFCDASGYSPKGFAQFWQDYFERHAENSGFNPEQIKQAKQAVRQWGEQTDAYYGRTRCEAVAQKPR